MSELIEPISRTGLSRIYSLLVEDQHNLDCAICNLEYSIKDGTTKEELNEVLHMLESNLTDLANMLEVMGVPIE